MQNVKLKAVQRSRRKLRVRKRVFGTAQRPRLSVTRSLNHIYAQLIDDDAGVTLCSASSRHKTVAGQISGACGNRAAAAVVGKALAEAATAKGIAAVAFDRNGYKYHGRIKALADAAREAGLKF